MLNKKFFADWRERGRRERAIFDQPKASSSRFLTLSDARCTFRRVVRPKTASDHRVTAVDVHDMA